MNLIKKLTNKKYISPSIEIRNLSEEDVIRTSSETIEYNEELVLNTLQNSKMEEDFLNSYIESFFPKSGVWYSCCFDKSERRQILKKYLPCHLRDKVWLSKLIAKSIANDHLLHIHYLQVYDFILKSERFDELRHEYELEIVRWQIDWMRNGGENWIMPKGFGDTSMLFSSDCDKCFRGGVVETLRAIDININVIEEGIEKYSHMWKDKYMALAFNHKYDPIGYLRKIKLEPADESHIANWIKLRKYQYYQEHKEFVDKYGTKDIELSEQEAKVLKETLNKQNEERLKLIEEWQKSDNSIFSNYSTYRGDNEY